MQSEVVLGKVKKSRRIWVWGIIIVVAAAAFGLGYAYMVMLRSESTKMIYELVMVKQAGMAKTIIVAGIVKPEMKQTLYFDTDKGDDVKFLVQQGGQVQVGTPLVKYMQRTNKEDMKRAQLALRSLELQREELELRRKGLERQLSTVMSSQDEEQMNHFHDQITQLETDEKRILISEQETQLTIDELERDATDTIVYSSLEGTVSRVLQINDGYVPSEPIVELVSTSQIVEADVSEYELENVQLGQSALFRSKVFPNREWKGKISFRDEQPAETTAAGEKGISTYPVKLSLMSGTHTLANGSHVNVEIQTVVKEVLAVPYSSVFEGMWDQALNSDKKPSKKVYVVTADGTVEQREVKTGLISDQMIEIKSGVSEGERVVKSPSLDILVGMKIIEQNIKMVES
ncbi:efflux RND transporter periplasmic adaptor subunit [Paenibacillus oenotherae]|uniref:Efflux RND transporter periplasmic adaptor subunit n=1 Tax=Paenibacillus oenotherae TaxID=1435645 RepID=A0ABS7D6D7_9BACL|nr:efflux RND transporter periplasmic adaptor subunit [Paenibacillus oenotherae]MBW7475499.1 efflux RND transporter periplasmic adaptor subunit [Paenibacillus oenotherae]